MRIVVIGSLCALLIAIPFVSSSQCPQTTTPTIDLAFCLDTTSSMDTLIENAKSKIWFIINAVAKVKPAPKLRIGFVVYRDVQDLYVTQVHDFTADIEGMYSQLREFQAQGGGDEPEHVNKALNDAVNKLSWTTQPNSVRLLFLVGDAPPHLDYTDGYRYQDAASQAKAKGIFINAIQCGNSPETATVWKEIARLGSGMYAAIQPSASSTEPVSPYDADLANLSSEISGTYVRYGGLGKANQKAQITHDADALRNGSSAADRAEAKSGTLYNNASWDLIDALQSKTIKLQDVPQESLPTEMRGLTISQMQEYVQDKAWFRLNLQKQVQSLSEKRKAFLDDAATKSAPQDSFDQEVLKALKSQANLCF